MTTRIWTIPNIITFLRLAGIPVFVWILFGVEHRLTAAILLGSLGATDWVDGFLARKLKQESDLGRILDPTADRLVILTAIPCLLIDESVPFVFGLVSLGRECAVAIAVLVLAAFKLDTVKVNWFGKTGTLALLTAFPLFLLSNAEIPSGAADTTQILAWVFGLPGLIFSYIAVVQYIPAVFAQIQNKKI